MQCGRYGRWIEGIDTPACHAVHDCVRTTAERPGDARQTASGGLQVDNAKTFDLASRAWTTRHRIDIRSRERVGQLVLAHVWHDRHSIVDSPLIGRISEPFVITVPDDEIVHIGMVEQDPMDGVKHDVVSLAFLQPSNCEHHLKPIEPKTVANLGAARTSIL